MITVRRLLILAVSALAFAHTANGQVGGKGLVINEIYIGSAAPQGTAATDQFIELYNPQTTTQYLDGDMIVRFGTGGKLTGGALLAPAQAWKFPGKPGGTTIAVAPGAFIVIAASAKNFNGGLDLSTANFETYTGNPGNDQDNANVPNLHPVGVGAVRATDLQLSAVTDAVVLTDGTDTVITDGLKATSVIDGVQYNIAWVAGALPATIDAGFTGGPNLKYGYAMERTVKGVTTLNSTKDFLLYLPSPGSEHGTAPPPPPPVVVKASDLMPFEFNRFVSYNEYDTATAGSAPTKSTASTTVISNNISFNGENGVALVRDTSGNTGPGANSTADLHYLATSAGDIQVFADQSLVAASVPAGLGITFTLPNKFVDYLKMSGGINVSYPVAVGNGTATVSGVPLTITITSTGKYRGIETNITVPAGRFDTTYRFDISDLVNISGLGGLVSGNFTLVQSLWLRKGVGIIKSNTPIASTTISGQPVSAGGTEKEMTAYGIRSTSGVTPSFVQSYGIKFYPDPAPEAINVALPKPARRVILYSATGQMVRSYDVAGDLAETVLWVADIPNGPYLARIQFVDGTQGSSHIIVQH